MSTSHGWYYVDAHGQQQGPVSAAVLVCHARQGKLGDSSLLWREGLTGWMPLSQLRDELGLTTPPAPAPLPEPNTLPATADGRTLGEHLYAPPSARLEEPDRFEAMRDADVVPAGFLRRWAALFIDYIIVGVAFQILQIFVGIFAAMGMASILAGDPTGGALVGTFMIGFGLLYFAMAGLYFSLMESSARQATVGKMALGIKVTDMAGRRLGFGHALGRWVAAALSYLTLWIGYLMAAFTQRKRALHDYVADTQVVDRWAYTSHPERQQRGLSGCLVAVLVAMALATFMVLSVMLAVAIPAYQDFVDRANRGGMSVPTSAPAAAPASAALPTARLAHLRSALS
ncbi:MAG: RDD family protein [Aquimonas sp.]|nr:RDD family protein [Aquimonas sp.]